MQRKLLFATTNTAALHALERKLTPEADTQTRETLTVIFADYRSPDIEGHHERALKSASPYILAFVSKDQVWLGPEVIPNETACWRCLSLWLRLREPEPPEPPTNSALDVLATALRRVAVADPEWNLVGKLAILDEHGGSATWHTILPRPDCPDCGPTYNTSNDDAFSRLSGSIGSLGSFLLNHTQHQSYGLVHVVGEILTPHAPSVPPERAAGIVVVGGQGTTPEAAERAFLGEACERYSTVFQGHEPRVTSTFEALKGPALHPRDLLQFSKLQYATRDPWNHQEPQPFPYIPPPFGPGWEMEWTAATTLSRESIWVPVQFCYSASAPEGEPLFCVADSNGCAAGATSQDAFVRAFLELIERDATAIWWCNRLQRPEVTIESFASPDIAQLAANLQATRDLHLLDLTTDLDVPVIAAISTVEGRRVAMGFGAHFYPLLACRRALTECAQIAWAWDTPTQDHEPGSLEHAYSLWQSAASLDSDPYLKPALEISAVANHARGSQPDIESCRELARRHSLTVAVLDMTRPEIGVPVVRVICPELRHPWRRHAPGRLYDVPVQMGWLPRPLRESELNPVTYCL
jgi:ribosomal protein S12 methylthiotransferase accessory factor